MQKIFQFYQIRSAITPPVNTSLDKETMPNNILVTTPLALVVYQVTEHLDTKKYPGNDWTLTGLYRKLQKNQPLPSLAILVQAVKDPATLHTLKDGVNPFLINFRSIFLLTIISKFKDKNHPLYTGMYWMSLKMKTSFGSSIWNTLLW